MFPFPTPLLTVSAGAPPVSSIQYVGGNKLAYAPSASVGGSLSLTSLSGGTDSAPSENDYVVVALSISGSSDQVMALTSSGYTKIADLYADDNADANLGVFIKKMGSTPDTTVDAPASGNVSYGGVIIVSVWRGVDLTTPQDVTVTTATGANSALADPPAITPVTTGAMIIAIGAAGAANSSGSNASDYTSGGDLSNFQTTYSPYSNCGMGSKSWTGGAFDPAAWSCADNIRSSWAACCIALRPA